MTHYTFLLIGLIYTTLLPGFVVTELFFPRLVFWKKMPLYLILSVIVSCYFSYFVSLIFGFTRVTLLGCFLIFLALFVNLLLRRKVNIGQGIRKQWLILLTGILIYAIYFTALYPAIFNLHDGYFVMGGPNWQDTAMHLSIIQSLAQGNFPPQAPYFSGQPLSYYYFSDFHAAIVNTLFGKFFPEILVLLNPFFAVAFFFSVFALAYEISKKKIFSIVSGLAAVFYGNLGFINLAKEVLSKNLSYISVVTANPFNFDSNYLQMTPVADYFLQNRPMMIGLPAFILVILLLLNSEKTKKDYQYRLLIAGIITAALIKFQLFGFIVSWVFFGVYLGFKYLLRKIKFYQLLKYFFIFGLPSLLAGILFASSKVEGRSFFNIFLDSFSWGPWQKHDVFWYVYFLGANLGLGIVIYLFGIFFKKTRNTVEILSIYVTSFVLIAVPLSTKFTIYEFDMLKFFYYLVPLVCVLLAYFYGKLKYKRLSILVFVLVAALSSLTSVNMLIHSYLSKSQGYSRSDYEAGIWITENTPQKSVFVTMPTVHSAPTDIGGRLRIISYINWPYSHGFNWGQDNVFSRVKDVEAVYKTGDIGQVKLKYGAEYVFYGEEERDQFPGAEKLFTANKGLRPIYDSGGIKIYAVL